MQSVSNAYKQVVSSTSALSPKTKIVIDGVEYLGDVIKTSPKITHTNTSFLGGFSAKTISFDIFELENNLNLENKEIIVYKGIVVNGSVEWVKQGVFIPQAKDITHNISTRVITITNAQDRTQLFDSKYESSLDWSINHTGLEIVQEICTKLNVNLETTDFGWANYSFKQPNFSNMTTYREVISRMAELGGEVALISCDGNLQIKGQYTTGDTIQRHRYEKLSKEKPYAVNTLVLGKKGIDDDIIYQDTNLINAGIGKNKIDITKYEETDYHKGTFEVIGDTLKITITKPYTAVNNFVVQWKTKLKPNTTYTIRGKVEHSNSEQAAAWYLYSDRLWGSGSLGNAGATASKTFATDDTGNLVIGFYLRTNIAIGDIVTISNFQIEEGNKVTSYEVFEETGVKEFRIEDNPFIDLYREEMISNVASFILGKTYTPFELNSFVDGFIYELNDVIKVIDKNGNPFDAVILDYSSQSRIKSNVKADSQDKNKTNYNLVGSKANAIGQVKLEVDHINETITALTSRVEDLTDYLKSSSGTGTLVLDETIVSEGSIGKLVISGFNEIGLYPNMVYPNSKIFPNKLSTYCIVQSNEDGSLVKETYIDLEMILDSSDELIIENSKVYVKSGNKTTDTGLTALLRTYENVSKISVKYFSNVSFTCDYIMKNELTKSFATQAEVSSQFLMTQENINSKVTKAEVISEINQSADEVKIKANKISLEGIVTANANFKILEDGSIESKNGSFSGNIYLQNGNRVIGGDGILTNLQFSSVGNYEGYGLLGFNYNSFDDSYTYADISIDVDIPDNFTIEHAYLTLYHTQATWSYYNDSMNENIDIQGYARNLKVYETSGSNQNYSFYMTYGGDYVIDLSSGFLTEITNGFGVSSYTPSSDYGAEIDIKKTIDIMEYLRTGEAHKIVVRTSESIPTSESVACSKTGMARAVVNVIGYMSM